MQTDPIALGRAEAERLGVKPFMTRDGNRYWWEPPLPLALYSILAASSYDTEEAAYAALGRAIIACRAACGYDALERERDELLARVERMKLSLLEIQAIEGEINPSNYDHEGVCFLNSAFIKAGTIADDALSLEKAAATPAEPERKD